MITAVLQHLYFKHSVTEEEAFLQHSEIIQEVGVSHSV